ARKIEPDIVLDVVVGERGQHLLGFAQSPHNGDTRLDFLPFLFVEQFGGTLHRADFAFSVQQQQAIHPGLVIPWGEQFSESLEYDFFDILTEIMLAPSFLHEQLGSLFISFRE
ncbi:MAG: hypothetical protein GTO41_23205, partial [Burkholderiales bacterium]|nr:hypothetical protein [Burkholderiales bacterium]